MFRKIYVALSKQEQVREKNMTAQEMLKEAEAEANLEAMGYTKVNCPACVGGNIGIKEIPMFGTILAKCTRCGGDGIMWEKCNKRPE